MCEHFAINPKKIRSSSVKIEISHPCVIRLRWQRNLGWFLTYSNGFWNIQSFALCFGADNPNSRPCAELKMGRFQPDGPLRRRFFKIFPTRSGLYLNSRYSFWGLNRHSNQKTRSFYVHFKNQKNQNLRIPLKSIQILLWSQFLNCELCRRADIDTWVGSWFVSPDFEVSRAFHCVLALENPIHDLALSSKWSPVYSTQSSRRRFFENFLIWRGSYSDSGASRLVFKQNPSI